MGSIVETDAKIKVLGLKIYNIIEGRKKIFGKPLKCSVDAGIQRQIHAPCINLPLDPVHSTLRNC